jgi:diadenylate cyclase
MIECWEIVKCIIEIGIIFTGIYGVLYYFRNTNGVTSIVGITIVGGLLWLLSFVLEFVVIPKILLALGNSLVIILFIIFQAEIRRFFAQIGTLSYKRGAEKRHLIGEVVVACNDMAHDKCGALIVLEKKIKLQNYINGSVELDIKVNNLILKSIFFPNSPLHDGAVIIRKDRIVAAGCFFPLTKDQLAQNLGTRHRAAKGISEENDAVVIVVSEETGAISIAHNGKLYRDLTGQDLEQLLEKLFVIKDDKEFDDTAKYIEQEESQEMIEQTNYSNNELLSSQEAKKESVSHRE